MIEQRLARLERHRHAHAVDLREDVIVQVGVHVDVHRAIERVGGSRTRRIAHRNAASGSDAADRPPEPGGVEAAARRLVEHAVFVLQRERVPGRMREMSQRARALSRRVA